MIDSDSGIDWVAAHIFTPGIETVLGAGNEVAEGTGSIRILSVLEDLAIMLVGISANTDIVRVVCDDIDVIDGSILGFSDLTELRIDE